MKKAKMNTGPLSLKKMRIVPLTEEQHQLIAGGNGGATQHNGDCWTRISNCLACVTRTCPTRPTIDARCTTGQNNTFVCPTLP